MAEVTRKELGKADWLYDPEMDMHLPCCRRIVPAEPGGFAQSRICHNGPLSDPQIETGDCGLHGPTGALRH